MKHKLLIGALLAALLGVGVAGPTYALDGAKDTFTVSEISDDVAEIRFGSNLLLAGNLISSDKSSQPAPLSGLLLTAGNQIGLDTKSEYALVAGNIIDYRGQTEKDLFIAGNIINVHDQAKVGRDTFIAGNVVTVEADMPNDLSVTAAKVIINGINVKGNLNISAEDVIIEGKANVDGKFTVNADAKIDGIANLTYGELEKYELVENDVTATEILLAKILSVASLFVAFAIVMALFPAVKQRIDKELSTTQFAKDLFIGMMVLLFVPIIAVFLLISIVGAPAALILLAAYVVMLYLAQGYTGLWLGKLIVEKVARGKVNAFVEMLIGITILALLVMIPWAGPYFGLLSLLLGLGLFMQSIKPNRPKKTLDRASGVREAETVKLASEDTKAQSKKTTEPSTKSAKTQKTVKEEE